jgi:hypothetical protein
MAKEPRSAGPSTAFSLDVWALLLAFILALAVKLDLLKKVPW